MIVVDTNVLANLLMTGPRTEACRRLMAKDSAWRMPGLWRWEFANVASMASKHGGMAREDGDALLSRAERNFRHAERFVSLNEAYAAAMDFGVTAYDGSFLALARRIQTLLVTDDKKLRKAAPKLTVSIEDFLK